MQSLNTPNVWFQKWHEELGELLLEHSNFEKLYFDEVFFYPKHIIFQLQNFREMMCHETEG